MAIINCKICGGEIEIPAGVTAGECPYCHTLTTFPCFDFSGAEDLFRRAEEARLSCNFDKAISTYEEIIRRGTSDPEAYWGLVLSTWGIEYVKDPFTKERKPTCHRVQFESMPEDANFKKTLELAGTDEADLYREEAMKIAEIQERILKISSQEKPFDVFICYKENDDFGQRTEDSVLAQKIYDKLCEFNYKVFFSRVTLEDKVGLYEPYIFSALNSAKVMLVIGSKKEYFEAIWVRNEWSRFLFLMRKQQDKVLIPCYRNMDVYDIPKELSMFQAQDMNKIGFIQDLMLGLTKVLGEKPLKQIVSNSSSGIKGTGVKSLKIILSIFITIFILLVGWLLLKTKLIKSSEDKVFNLSGVPLKMIKVKAGRFQMGIPDKELKYRKEEYKLHWVELTEDYWLGETEVTQKQWMAIMGTNPSRGAPFNSSASVDYPVDYISWTEAKEFCDRLNAMFDKEKPQGYEFSLPTEAQWEYASRAGKANQDKQVDWRGKTAEEMMTSRKTSPVAQRPPNDWGFYDMLGNVWELCYDWFRIYEGDDINPVGRYMKEYENLKVARGGSVHFPAFCSSHYRIYFMPDKRTDDIGFRLALVPIREVDSNEPSIKGDAEYPRRAPLKNPTTTP